MREVALILYFFLLSTICSLKFMKFGYKKLDVLQKSQFFLSIKRARQAKLHLDSNHLHPLDITDPMDDKEGIDEPP